MSHTSSTPNLHSPIDLEVVRPHQYKNIPNAAKKQNRKRPRQIIPQEECKRLMRQCIIHRHKVLYFPETECFISLAHSNPNQAPLINIPVKYRVKGASSAFKLGSCALRATQGHPPETHYHASHLCGNCRCFNAKHLVWEEPSVNIDRDLCHSNKRAVCPHNPPCLFHDGTIHRYTIKRKKEQLKRK
jgi:hypothetical protein